MLILNRKDKQYTTTTLKQLILQAKFLCITRLQLSTGCFFWIFYNSALFTCNKRLILKFLTLPVHYSFIILGETCLLCVKYPTWFIICYDS